MAPGMVGEERGGEVLILSSAWHNRSGSQRLQQQEAPEGRAEQQGEVVPAGIRVCGPGGRDRRDLVSVKVTGWCGSHLCTRVTAQAAREVRVSTGKLLWGGVRGWQCWAGLWAPPAFVF